MEFSTVEDIEEITVKLAYCSMKSRSGKQLNSRWNISLLINQAVVQDDKNNAEDSEVDDTFTVPSQPVVKNDSSNDR
jgi:hypothetical protein